MIMIENINMIHISNIDIWPMLLSWEVPHTSNSSHLFWKLEDPVLVQTLMVQILSYKRKITYHISYYLLVFFLFV